VVANTPLSSFAKERRNEFVIQKTILNPRSQRNEDEFVIRKTILNPRSPFRFGMPGTGVEAKSFHLPRNPNNFCLHDRMDFNSFGIICMRIRRGYHRAKRSNIEWCTLAVLVSSLIPKKDTMSCLKFGTGSHLSCTGVLVLGVL
jgi:hypothetical protein